MKDCFYYYGIGAEVFRDLKYTDALKVKINAGRELLNELSQKLYLTKVSTEEFSELSKRITDVIKAIKFNERLLNECGIRS